MSKREGEVEKAMASLLHPLLEVCRQPFASGSSLAMLLRTLPMSPGVDVVASTGTSCSWPCLALLREALGHATCASPDVHALCDDSRIHITTTPPLPHTKSYHNPSP